MTATKMLKRDYYEVLGIDRGADQVAIKKSYRSLAMKYHPDRNPGDAQAVERMKEINEAYAVLSDTHKRRLYDTYGHAGLEGYTQEDIFRGVDFSSLFREFGLRDFFGFGDSLFESFFGRRTSIRREPGRGADLRYDLAVTLEEAAFGTEKTVQLPKTEQCSACRGAGAPPDGLEQCASCQGTGQIVREERAGYSVFRQISVCSKCHGKGKVVKQPCKECEGKGFIKRTKGILVRIPAGVDTGYEVKFDGEGDKGEGAPGDLYVVINVQRHPIFERHSDDIYLQKEINFTTAALGGKVEVPSLEGNIKLDIPEGTQTGAILRITGKGVARLNGHGKGDEYVIARVVTPTNLSHKQKELLREFEKLEPESEDDTRNQKGKD